MSYTLTVNMGVKVFLLTVLTVCTSYMVSSQKNVVCYYGSWATYRSGLGKFDVDNIDPFLCTHLIYTFVGINDQGTVVSLDSWLDLPDNWGRDNFGKFNALKQQNPKLKTLLAVGGWNEGSAKYSAMAANAALRKNFINSALNMVKTYRFDGFDLDWEYPNRRDTVHGQADIDNFSILVKELKEEFQKSGLLLTAAVSSVGASASLSYDIPTISKYLDLINIMAYDMYGAWDPVTGHNAPLHKGEGDGNADRENLFTVDVAVEYWLNQGCPPEKLVVGVPFYGRSFTLTDASDSGVRAPSSGAGIAGPFTVTPGNVGYNEFCNMLRTQSWEIRQDNLAKVPYAVQGRNWVSYDDPASITKKVEYALSKNVSNIMMWSIETDDFHGICSGVSFPLLRAINTALERSGNTVSTTEAPSTSTTASSTSVPSSSTTTTSSSTATVTTTTTAVPENTTPNGGNSPVCKSEGLIANPNDCAEFIMCVKDINGVFIQIAFQCPSGTKWDSVYQFCNFEHKVQCVSSTSSH